MKVRNPMSVIFILMMLAMLSCAIKPTLDILMDFIRQVAPYVGWGVALFLATAVSVRLMRRS